ncbi:hypothetical protein JB92DRAFT_2862118 [Gautieria morchelliformis]|nr:hypothetical protein JB92DRAFT_2862118 [Gautieria morchelliformis]
MVVSVWPSLVYVAGQLMNPARSSSLRVVRLGTVGTKRSPHPADPPVCMAKLIMLRHRMQQASTRKSQKWAGPVSKANVYGNARHRSSPAWVGSATVDRRWGYNR